MAVEGRIHVALRRAVAHGQVLGVTCARSLPLAVARTAAPRCGGVLMVGFGLFAAGTAAIAFAVRGFGLVAPAARPATEDMKPTCYAHETRSRPPG